MHTKPSKTDLRYLGTMLPETGFLRLPAVLSLVPMGKTTLWNKVRTGHFPKPVKLGARITAWRCEDIRTFIDQPNQSAAPKDTLNSKGGDVSCK